MEQNRLNFHNELQKKIPDIIEAFVLFHGEEERNRITTLFTSTPIVGYLDYETCKDEMAKIKKECINKTIKSFFDKTGIPNDKEHIDRYFGSYISDISYSKLQSFYNAIENGVAPDFLLDKVKDLSGDKTLELGSEKEKELIKRYKALKPAYDEAIVYFNREMDKYKEQFEYVDKLTTLKNALLEKYIGELVEELYPYFDEKDKKIYDENKDKSVRYYLSFLDRANVLFRGFGDPIDQPSLIDSFTTESEKALEEGEYPMLVSGIKFDRISYFKSKGFDFGNDYDLYMTNKDCLSTIPSKEFADKIVSIKKEKQDSFYKELLLSMPHMKPIMDSINALGIDPHKVDDYISIIKRKRSAVIINIGSLDGTVSLAPIVLINGKIDEETIDTIIIHELSHLFELYLNSINLEKNEMICTTGWDVITEKIFEDEVEEEKPEQRKPREYEKSSEIVNEYISQDISRLMHDNGIFLFSSKEKAKNTSRSGYETQMGRFAIDFYEQFKDIIIEARKKHDLSILTNVIGEENFVAYNKLLDAISQRYPGTEIYKPFHDIKSGNTTTKEAIEYLEFERQYKELLSSMITMSKNKGIKY